MRAGSVNRVLAACVVALVAPFVAAAPTDAMEPAPGPNTAAPQSGMQAEVVLAGTQAQSPELIELLRTVLTQQGVSPGFVSRQHWVDSDLLEADPAGDGARARIWITLPSPRLARLYFADPRLRRYLVREVALRDGLDELGRERIARVVESSTLALLHGARGMSRAEVRRTLRAQARAAPAVSKRVQEPAAAKNQTPPRPDPGTGLGAFVGASYFGQWTGRHLGIAHGPGLRLGLRLDRSRAPSWLGTALVERPFVLAHDTSEIRVRLQSTRTRVLFGWLQRLQEQTSLVLQVGGGAEFTRISPTAASGAEIDPAPVRTNATVWLSSELGIQWSPAAWSFMLAATCELSPDRTHYDIERDGLPERVFKTAPLRPGAFAAVTYDL